MPFLVLKRSTVIFALVLLAGVVSAAGWFLLGKDSISVFSQDSKAVKPREIHMVTGEFKAKLPDGKEIEAYRWDPGTIFIKEGEEVVLKISGINGMEHPFIIEGTDIKGIVKKGGETTVPIKIEKEGIYRLVCLTHPDKDSNGPMIGYIVVD
jgi:plastocyanin